jgi:threonylcarbamoyladenosine tRNA methylthiotransferase MtaB
MSTYLIKTLGCKANFYDSQLMEADFVNKGWRPFTKMSAADSADLCIVNSCTVTDEADRQSRKLCARLARENPKAKIVITGCAAEVDPERLTQSKGIHYVIGNQNKNLLVDIILEKIQKSTNATESEIGEVLGSVQSYESMTSRHPHDREWPDATQTFAAPERQGFFSTAKTRVFLKIQEGCNSFCTYCIIPYGRGPSRSLSIEQIVDQINQLLKLGTQEVVLTGTNIGDYGTDWSNEPQFSNLVEKILSETSLRRLRLSSLDPTEIDSKLFGLMSSEERLCPHFHISLQSPNNKILKLMKRKYTTRDVETCLTRIAKIERDIYVGMDLITGFPGESNSDFEDSYTQLASLPWTRLHVFPYSERSGTPATRLPHSVEQRDRYSRTRLLNELSMQRLNMYYKKALAHHSNLHSVLMERYRSKDQSAFGLTPNYLRIQLSGDERLSSYSNKIISVRPTQIQADFSAQEIWLSAEL